MKSIETTTSFGGDQLLSIRHVERRELTSHERDGLVLESLEDNDILTEVEVRQDTQTDLIRVHWSTAASSEFHAMYVPETQRLFLGASEMIGVVDLDQNLIVLEEYPLLFWSLERLGDHVVIFGEIECLLCDLFGAVVDRAPVDPPYEIERTPEGILFQSIVAGSTSLRFDHNRNTEPTNSA